MIDSLLAQGRLAEVLLVEDNDNDVELTRLAFKAAKVSVSLHHVPNGEECLQFLRNQGKYADAPTPDLVLLDLNMPRMDGTEVMEEIANDPDLGDLKVVILTSSKAEEDGLRAHKLRCSAYLVKPIDFTGFVNMIHSLSEHWLKPVEQPPTK